jgi:hypothetical protein
MLITKKSYKAESVNGHFSHTYMSTILFKYEKNGAYIKSSSYSREL